MAATLDLRELSQGLPALTPNHGAALAEAASVCLDEQGHPQGQVLLVRGTRSNTYELTWYTVTNQLRLTYADPDEATEWGATAVALLLARKELGFEVVSRSWKGTGFDYWLGQADSLPFQEKERLEVSGIRRGRPALVHSRVRRKLAQMAGPGADQAGWVIVVEFGGPIAEVHRNE